ncbi:MAG TPA: hypothetical protein VGF95_09455 [Solirubrobacteraceae bacterium]|jgi:hypothetical protein
MRFGALSSWQARRGLGALVAAAALALTWMPSTGSALAAEPAWSPVAATGPTVLPPVQSEVQKVSVDAEGGTFTLTARHLAATGVGYVLGNIGSKLVTSTGAFAKGQVIEGGSLSAGDTFTSVSGSTFGLTISASEIGQFPLFGYSEPETTASLPYDASAAEVQAALEALGAIGSGNVSVSGGQRGATEVSYVVSFGGGLADANVAQLAPASGSLVSGSANVLTQTQGGPGWSRLSLMAQNIGGLASSGATITYRATLPAGITAIATPVTGSSPSTAVEWACGASTAEEVVCTSSAVLPPSQALPPINAMITAAPGTEAGIVHMEVSGGGAGAASGELPLTISTAPAKPGVESFVAGAYDPDGASDTRAGGHPYSASAAIFANTVLSPMGRIVPAGELRNILVELPPGFLGNPIAVPACPESTPTESCNLDTMVGFTEPVLATFGSSGIPASVFNTQAPYGFPAKYRFVVAGVESLAVVGSLRSDGDYGVDAASLNTPQVEAVFGAFFTFWGEPASVSHDSSRCKYGFGGLKENCEASDVANTAFLTNATDCAEQAAVQPVTNLTATLWQDPEEIFNGSVAIPPVSECDALKFEASFGFQPRAAAQADSPTGFTTEVAVPSEGLTDPEKLTNPEVKRVVASLPEGVVLNAAAVEGLSSCSEQQIGFEGANFPMPNPMHFDKSANQCPESSKIGTVELTTALLEEPLHGALYLAAQGQGNPFGSLFALYLVIEDPRHGVFIKLPGKVAADSKSGDLTVTFEDLPQLPFTSMKLQLKGGSHAPLSTPNACGLYTSHTEMLPWSAPESGAALQVQSGFEVASGPGGGACPTNALQPSFTAGVEDAVAGSSSAFRLDISRPDGSQRFAALNATLPAGLLGYLKGIPECSDAALASVSSAEGSGAAQIVSPSCPADSQLGTVSVAVGSGGNPFHVNTGRAYLAGPYEGAPFSIAIVTPAVAGPFDLGSVVVRSGLFIDRKTAQVTVKSDPLPTVLDGVPLDIRAIDVDIDRSGFIVAPTSCEPMNISGQAIGEQGATAPLSDRFQVGECAALGFKPAFTASTQAKTSRQRGASLAVQIAYPSSGSEANIASVKVELPKKLPSRLSTLQQACTEEQFAENPAGCPEASIVGSATAVTPLLNSPLSGPAYFVSHGGAKFPELIIVLQGEGVTIQLEGETFISKKGITSSTFKTVPDAPVSSFKLTLPEGKGSALAAPGGKLCEDKLLMPTTITAQNGKALTQSTKIKVTGCTATKKKTSTRKKKKKHAGKQHKARRRG